MKPAKLYLSLFSLSLLFCSCSKPQKEKLLIFAPASTARLFESLLKNSYCKSQNCLISYASSASLARQILYGSSPDIYISADPRWMDHLAAKDLLLKQSRKRLFANHLVLASQANSNLAAMQTKLRKGNKRDAAYLREILNQADCWSTANPESVPLGHYAKQALKHMGLWYTSKARLRTAADARRALYLLERGECKIGILYKSDTYNNKKVKTLYHFPSQLHNTMDPIYYEIALLKNRYPHRKSILGTKARALYTFLTGPQSKAFYLKFGFSSRVEVE